MSEKEAQENLTGGQPPAYDATPGYPQQSYGVPEQPPPSYQENTQYGFQQPGIPQYGNQQQGIPQHGHQQSGNPQYGYQQQGIPQPGYQQQGIPGYGYQGVRQQGGLVYDSPPKDYMALAIVTTILFFWPLGIFAIMKANESRVHAARGDYLNAHLAANKSKNFSIIAMIIGVVVIAAIIVIWLTI